MARVKTCIDRVLPSQLMEPVVRAGPAGGSGLLLSQGLAERQPAAGPVHGRQRRAARPRDGAGRLVDASTPT